MKTYIIVTNDELEFPVSDEIIGSKKVAKELGITLNRFYHCMYSGFPRKAKLKAVVIEDKQFEDAESHQRELCKQYAMTHDRTEYYKNRYLKRKAGECFGCK